MDTVVLTPTADRLAHRLSIVQTTSPPLLIHTSLFTGMLSYSDVEHKLMRMVSLVKIAFHSDERPWNTSFNDNDDVVVDGEMRLQPM